MKASKNIFRKTLGAIAAINLLVFALSAGMESEYLFMLTGIVGFLGFITSIVTLTKDIKSSSEYVAYTILWLIFYAIPMIFLSFLFVSEMFFPDPNVALMNFAAA